jgi:hypothetical protein
MGFTIGTMFRSCFGGQTNPQENHSNYHRKTIPAGLSESLIPSKKSEGILDTGNRKPPRNSPHPNVLGDTTRPTHTPATRIDFSNLNQPYWDIRASKGLSGSNHGIETSRPLRLAPRTIYNLRERFLRNAHSPACGTKFFTQSDPRNPGSEITTSQPSLPRASSNQNAGIEQHGVPHDHILQFEFDDQDLRQTNVSTSDHSLNQNH